MPNLLLGQCRKCGRDVQYSNGDLIVDREAFDRVRYVPTEKWEVEHFEGRCDTLCTRLRKAVYSLLHDDQTHHHRSERLQRSRHLD